MAIADLVWYPRKWMESRSVANKSDPRIKAERMIGRCEMFDEIACGGMATIHLGRVLGASSFQRTVAIKRLHPQFALMFGAVLLGIAVRTRRRREPRDRTVRSTLRERAR